MIYALGISVAANVILGLLLYYVADDRGMWYRECLRQREEHMRRLEQERFWEEAE